MRGHLTSSAAIALTLAAAATASGQCLPPWLETDGFPGVTTDGESLVNAMLSWDPDGAGPQPEVLVVGGRFSVAGDAAVNGVAMWDGTAWHTMATSSGS
jgi:hypothetical protein